MNQGVRIELSGKVRNEQGARRRGGGTEGDERVQKRVTAKGLHAGGLYVCLYFCRCSGPGNSMSGKVKEIQGWAGSGISVSRSNPQRCEGKGGGERKKWWYWRRLWHQGDKISGEVDFRRG